MNKITSQVVAKLRTKRDVIKDLVNTLEIENDKLLFEYSKNNKPIPKRVAEIDDLLSLCENRIDQLEEDIYKLTQHKFSTNSIKMYLFLNKFPFNSVVTP